MLPVESAISFVHAVLFNVIKIFIVTFGGGKEKIAVLGCSVLLNLSSQPCVTEPSSGLKGLFY